MKQADGKQAAAAIIAKVVDEAGGRRQAASLLIQIRDQADDALQFVEELRVQGGEALVARKLRHGDVEGARLAPHRAVGRVVVARDQPA